MDCSDTWHNETKPFGAKPQVQQPLNLHPDDLREINDAASEIKIQGARYPEQPQVKKQ